MSLIYREIYVGCGERQDGRWNVIVIPPGGAPAMMSGWFSLIWTFWRRPRLPGGCANEYASFRRRRLTPQMSF